MPKKILRGDAILLYGRSILDDCPRLLGQTVRCVEQAGYELKDQDQAIWVLAAGLFAMNTLGAYPALGPELSAVIFAEVDQFIDFLVDSRGHMPDRCRQMYRYYCHFYAQRDREYAANPGPENMPALATCAVMLLHLISGFDTDVDLPAQDMTGLAALHREFYALLSPSLSKMDDLLRQYDVVWEKLH
jgi:hypothetical protein